uniref:Cell cycle checkpoint control protein RAD9A n=1 Tax=Chromera velia CCMP2878 TaxID=1169474 RepID=A0A0G4G1I3_9ALVE|eukprot:Cvel_19704.t1-p1 / transcript=Cvel_19704.t1 / gene=Cvel_19704 / organism=Chromera_velia_CCMP2878 / gene_product=hypothetical protein / transcript_product=hypothetical protein / location=Cvel_scaffold1720:22746-26506(-) / protein_length=473 / sequence_SO=supercontig / SO=protein_coding / is_pseudo=false
MIQCKLHDVKILQNSILALQFGKEKRESDLIHCKISAGGFKFYKEAPSKDVAISTLLKKEVFSQWTFPSDLERAPHFMLPLSSFNQCLQVFCQNASVTLEYDGSPEGDSDFRVILEEEGAVFQCNFTGYEPPQEGPSLIFDERDEICCIETRPEVLRDILNEFAEEGAEAEVRLALKHCDLRPTRSDGRSAVEDETALSMSVVDETSSLQYDIPPSSSLFAELRVGPRHAPGGSLVRRFSLKSLLAARNALTVSQSLRLRINREGVMALRALVRNSGTSAQQQQGSTQNGPPNPQQRYPQHPNQQQQQMMSIHLIEVLICSLGDREDEEDETCLTADVMDSQAAAAAGGASGVSQLNGHSHSAAASAAAPRTGVSQEAEEEDERDEARLEALRAKRKRVQGAGAGIASDSDDGESLFQETDVQRDVRVKREQAEERDSGGRGRGRRENGISQTTTRQLSNQAGPSGSRGGRQK